MTTHSRKLLWKRLFDFIQVGLMVTLCIVFFQYAFTEVFQKKVDFDLLIGGGVIPLVWKFGVSVANFREEVSDLKGDLEEEKIHRKQNEELLLRLDAKLEIIAKQEQTNARVDRIIEQINHLNLKE